MDYRVFIPQSKISASRATHRLLTHFFKLSTSDFTDSSQKALKFSQGINNDNNTQIKTFSLTVLKASSSTRLNRCAHNFSTQTRSIV